VQNALQSLYSHQIRKRQGKQVSFKFRFEGWWDRLTADRLTALNIDRGDVTSGSRLFHVFAAATGKARSPMVRSRVGGTTNAEVDDECRRRQPGRMEESDQVWWPSRTWRLHGDSIMKVLWAGKLEKLISSGNNVVGWQEEHPSCNKVCSNNSQKLYSRKTGRLKKPKVAVWDRSHTHTAWKNESSM